MDTMYALATVVAPILLAVALAYALYRNRRTSARDKAITEAGTRDLYAQEDRIAQRDPAVDTMPVDRR